MELKAQLMYKGYRLADAKVQSLLHFVSNVAEKPFLLHKADDLYRCFGQCLGRKAATLNQLGLEIGV